MDMRSWGRERTELTFMWEGLRCMGWKEGACCAQRSPEGKYEAGATDWEAGGGARWPKLRPRVDSEGASLKNSLSNAIYVKKKSR